MKRVAIPQRIKSGEYPRIQPEAVGEAEWPDFARKRLAVSMYIEGIAMKEIRLRTGIPSNEVNRLAERFCTLDEDGIYFAERALVKHSRVGVYERTKRIAEKRSEQQGGMAGALNMLLTEHDEVEFSIIELIETPGAVLSGAEDGLNSLVSKFYQAIEKAGVGRAEWPFNTKHKGRTSIRKYLKFLISKHAVQYIHAHGTGDAIAHLSTGSGHGRYIKAQRPLDCVQLDGHSIDAIFSLRVEMKPGVYQWIVMNRIWLLSMIDPCSKAVLAYKLVLRSEVSAADVREVIAQACIGRWQPRELVSDEYVYKPGAGLPSGVIEECCGVSFGVLFADSALSNLAKKVTMAARTDFGFQDCIGPVGHFEARAEIERSFKEVARRVHSLVSSTGSHPYEGRATDAEKKAVQYEVDLTLMEDAMDVALANYNVTPTEGLGYLSPLGYLAQVFRQDILIPRYTEDQMERLRADMTTSKATVRGGSESGRRPYIQLDRAHYTNEVLSGDFAFVGMELLIEIDYHDYRAVKAYLPTGGCIGYLRAQGFWGEFKHTPAVRRQVNSLIRSGEIKIDDDASPIQLLSDYYLKRGEPGVALSIAREAEEAEVDHAVSKGNREKRKQSDYYIRDMLEDDDFPQPGQALNQVRR